MFKLKYLSGSIVFFLIVSTSNAQVLNTPIRNPMLTGKCDLLLLNGKYVRGEVRGIRRGPAGISRITVRDSLTKQKTQYYAEQIKTMTFRNTKFNKIVNFIDAFSSAQNATQTDFSSLKRPKIVYEHVAPYKGRHYCGELLNPDFCSAIKVFYAPFASPTAGWGKITGGLIRAYIVEKGGQSFKIKKGSYNRKFEKLFGDRPDFMKMHNGRKKFRDIGEHLFDYDQLVSKMK